MQEVILFLQVDSSVVSRRLPLQQGWAGCREGDQERPNGKSHFEICMMDYNCEREEAPSEHRLECVDEMNACYDNLAEGRGVGGWPCLYATARRGGKNNSAKKTLHNQPS